MARQPGRGGRLPGAAGCHRLGRQPRRHAAAHYPGRRGAAAAAHHPGRSGGRPPAALQHREQRAAAVRCRQCPLAGAAPARPRHLRDVGHGLGHAQLQRSAGGGAELWRAGRRGGQPASSALVSVALFFQDDQLHVASSRRLTSADLRVVCPGRAGILGDVIRTGEPAISHDPAHDPELVQFASLQACRSTMALPLRVGYETYGVVLYGHPRADFFDEDQQALLVTVVNQAINALQNAQLYRNLRQEKERLIEVQEEAQKKLARDLHDGPTQAVAALAMRANFVRRLLERDVKAASEELFKMEDLARRTTKEIRHMLFTLRPLVLESQGLTAALRQLAEKMHETHGQNVIVEAEPGVDDRLEMNHQGVLFYIVEEAVNNARKHAQAEHIWVRLKAQSDILVVEIQDDGVGFNVGAVDSNYNRRGSLGMVNMRERAEMISGAIKIDSAENRGTRVFVYIPLTDMARERMRT